MKSSKLAFLSLFISLALILSYVETQIPPIIPFPGIKIGLGNIAIIVVLYKCGFKDAFCISVLRVLLISILFGTFLSFMYSIVGAILSLLIMLILKKIGIFSINFVSAIGGISHNLGQILVAIFVTSTNELLYYLPILIIGGTICGFIIGLIGAKICVKIDFKNNF